MQQVKHNPLYYDKDGRLHYDGQNYPDYCSYCGSYIENKGTVILDTNLIFCNDNCLAQMIKHKTADIRISRKGYNKVYSRLICWLENDANAWAVTYGAIGFIILIYLL
jgi:hypothetical protein